VTGVRRVLFRSSKEYTEFESKHNRHLNMMAENVSRSISLKQLLG